MSGTPVPTVETVKMSGPPPSSTGPEVSTQVEGMEVAGAGDKKKVDEQKVQEKIVLDAAQERADEDRATELRAADAAGKKAAEVSAGQLKKPKDVGPMPEEPKMDWKGSHDQSISLAAIFNNLFTAMMHTGENRRNFYKFMDKYKHYVRDLDAHGEKIKQHMKDSRGYAEEQTKDLMKQKQIEEKLAQVVKDLEKGLDVARDDVKFAEKVKGIADGLEGKTLDRESINNAIDNMDKSLFSSQKEFDSMRQKLKELPVERFGKEKAQEKLDEAKEVKANVKGRLKEAKSKKHSAYRRGEEIKGEIRAVKELVKFNARNYVKVRTGVGDKLLFGLVGRGAEGNIKERLFKDRNSETGKYEDTGHTFKKRGWIPFAKKGTLNAEQIESLEAKKVALDEAMKALGNDRSIENRKLFQAALGEFSAEVRAAEKFGSLPLDIVHAMKNARIGAREDLLTLEKEIKENHEITALNGEIEGAQQKVDGLKDEIKGIKSDIKGKKKEIENDKKEISKAKKEIESADDEIKKIKESLAGGPPTEEQSKRLEELDGIKNINYGIIGSKNNHIKELEAEIKQKTEELDSTQAKLLAAEGEKAVLDGQRQSVVERIAGERKKSDDDKPEDLRESSRLMSELGASKKGEHTISRIEATLAGNSKEVKAAAFSMNKQIMARQKDISEGPYNKVMNIKSEIDDIKQQLASEMKEAPFDKAKVDGLMEKFAAIQGATGPIHDLKETPEMKELKELESIRKGLNSEGDIVPDPTVAALQGLDESVKQLQAEFLEAERIITRFAHGPSLAAEEIDVPTIEEKTPPTVEDDSPSGPAASNLKRASAPAMPTMRSDDGTSLSDMVAQWKAEAEEKARLEQERQKATGGVVDGGPGGGP